MKDMRTMYVTQGMCSMRSIGFGHSRLVFARGRIRFDWVGFLVCDLGGD